MEQQESCTPRENETETESTDVGNDTHIGINSKRPKRDGSEVWAHFTRTPVPNGKPKRCTCNYCGKDYSCLPGAGTSTKWVHVHK